MAVYDRWHKAPAPGIEPCSCGTAKRPLYPSAAHKQGLRWQVRWYDPEGKVRQPKRNFRLKEGKNPDLHADAFSAQVERDLDTGDYTAPADADITFKEYAEGWRKSRTHDDLTAGKLESHLRLHVYPVIGTHPLKLLAKRPSLTQAWIKGLEQKLSPASAQLVVNDVSGVYQAAAGDGIIRVNPVRHSSVTRPDPPPRKARAWEAARVAAMTAALAARWKVIPEVGAGTGLRQGEFFGLAAADITFLGKDPKIRVLRQVKYVNGRLHFAPPKRRKTRELPMSKGVADRLARHLAQFPAREVTLPWHDPRDRKRHGKPVTAALVFTGEGGGALKGATFTERVWNPARKKAGVPLGHDDGMHALRHTFASVQLGAGRSVTEVAAWMGDTPATVLSVYAHFLPGGEGGSRAATDAFLSSCALNVPSGQAVEGEAQGQGVPR